MSEGLCQDGRPTAWAWVVAEDLSDMRRGHWRDWQQVSHPWWRQEGSKSNSVGVEVVGLRLMCRQPCWVSGMSTTKGH